MIGSRRSAGLLVVILAIATVAGCTTPADDVSTATDEEEPIVFTSPDEELPTNRTSRGDVWHLHDYWGGQDSLVVMDVAESRRATFFSDYYEFRFRPEAGNVVPQGTSHVEVTMSWTSTVSETYANPELWVKTAEEGEPFRVGEIQDGNTLRVQTTNAQNDIPHEALSRWTFNLRVHPSGDAQPIYFEGEISVRVVAHRGLDIPLFPPHPDHWGNETEKHLFEVEVPAHAFMGDPRTGAACFYACPLLTAPENGSIVPPGTDVVEIVIEQPVDSPIQPGILYHGGDSREWTVASAEEESEGARVFRIPVERGQADGPYAKQSLWEFMTYAEEPLENVVYAGQYKVTARALRTS